MNTTIPDYIEDEIERAFWLMLDKLAKDGYAKRDAFKFAVRQMLYRIDNAEARAV